MEQNNFEVAVPEYYRNPLRQSRTKLLRHDGQHQNARLT